MDKTRSQAVLEKLDWTEASNREVASILADSGTLMRPDNPYLMAVKDFTKGLEIEATRKMALEDPDYQRPATVAEYFDNTAINKFYRLLAYGMLIRAHEHELEKESDPDSRARLEGAMEKAQALHSHLSQELEASFNYQAIPIKKLVTIQLECGIVMAQHIHSRS